MATAPKFHLSIPVFDLDATAQWYVGGLGARAGRRSAEALILDLGGHQLVAQLVNGAARSAPQPGIYPRHFGLIYAGLQEWQALLQRAQAAALRFGVEPKCRYRGEALEHHTFFLIDPSDNWLEFKHYVQAQAVLGYRQLGEVGDQDLR